MVVDLSFLETFTKGNDEKFRRYIRLYLDDAPNTFDRMRENIEEENWADLAINAHSLKPKTDFMGIATLKNILIQIEDCVRDANYSDIQNLFDQAFNINRAACEDLRKYLAQN